MGSLIKRISYKILVVSMITVVLSFFSANSISEAKLKLKEGEYYYTGTQEAELVVEGNFWDNLLNALGQIANYILGIMTLGTRGVVVGWIEIMEILLTAILAVPFDFATFISNSLAGMDEYSQQIVNVESIIFNKVPILQANIFKNENDTDTDEDSSLLETSTQTSTKSSKNIASAETNKIVTTIKNSIAKWYYVIRLMIIIFMLLFLIFIGIKIALSTIATEKAVYKKMLTDWVAGMIIIFVIHYLMIAILNINDSIVDSLRGLTENKLIQEEYEYGKEDDAKTTAQVESSLYETIRTRAYSLKLTDGFAGLILYGFLVYYAWKFALIYMKRLINVIILTLLAPVVSGSYALNKVLTGKSKVFNAWLTEYVMNVIIQIIHVIIYASFMTIAIKLSTSSISGFIITIIVLKFMSEADKILRELFKLTGGDGSLFGEMADKTSFGAIKSEIQTIKNAMVGGVVTKEAMKVTYGVASIPVKKAGMFIAKHGAKSYANSEAHQKWLENKENKSIEEANDFLAHNENAQKILKGYSKAQKMMANKKHDYTTARQQLYRNGYVASTPIDDEIKVMLGDLYNDNMKTVGDVKVENDAEVVELQNKTEAKLEKAFLTQQADNVTISEIFKDNFDNAMMGLVRKEGKRYVIRKESGSLLEMLKNKENREDLSGKEFLSTYINKKIAKRQSKTSLDEIFKQNMQIKKLFGLSDDENEQVKKEIEFWQNRIIGVMSSIGGMSMLAVNPLVAMALLVNAQPKKINAVKRRKIYESRATSPSNKVFKFRGLGIGPMFELGKPEMYQQLTQEKLDILHDKRIEKSVKNDIKRIKYTKEKFDEIRNDGKNVITQYNANWKNLKNETKQQVKTKSISELAFNQKLSENNTIDVGNGICMQLNNNKEMRDLFKNLEKIDNRSNISKNRKIDLICKEIEKKSNVIVQDVIMDMCVEKGITDIAKVNLQDNDIEFIKHNIEVSIEKTGIIERGEIHLSDVNITEQSINEELVDMKFGADITNQKIEEKVVSNAILEYMERNSIQNVNNLKNDSAKNEIYDTIKENLMTESTKQSAKVIMNLTGKNKAKEEIKLSQNIITSVDNQIDNIKKTTKATLTNNANKDKLIEKQVNRETNQIKQKLEEAVYTDNQDILDTINNNENIAQKQLELLMLLNSLKNMNKQAEELGPYITIKSKEKTKKKYQYYTNTNFKSYSQKQKVEANSRLSELDIEMEGPVANIVDLINNIGSK